MEHSWGNGQDDWDIYDQAYAEYLSSYEKTFNTWEEWDILKDKPNWYVPLGVGGSSSQYYDNDLFGKNEAINL